MLKLGQVFTPSYITDVVLDEAGYVNGNIINKKIIEPSFGNGNFLVNIVHRLILECKNNGYTNDDIKKQLENNVVGIEIDTALYNEAIERLNKVTQTYGVANVKWNLYNQDALEYKEYGEYDFVVGNPPYIRIHDIDKEKREKFKTFDFTKGTTDLYIIFYEIGIKLLNENGVLSYISPNSFMKNTSQKHFRKYLTDNNLITKIIEYKSQVFYKVDTYSAIAVISKNNTSQHIVYQEREMKAINYTTQIPYQSFKDKEKWSFSNEEDNEFLDEINKRKIKLDDLCTIQNGIATNKDSVYIGKVTEVFDDGTVRFKDRIIEKNILKPVIKASKATFGACDLYIIFPYKVNKEGKVEEIKEEDMQTLYPLTYEYLKENKKELDKRDMDSSGSQWYRYARSQGLKNSNMKKLVIQHIVGPEQVHCNVVVVPEDTIVYSGVYITTDSDKLLKKVKTVLNSESFCKYCKLVGKSMGGNYKSISTKDIKNYKI